MQNNTPVKLIITLVTLCSIFLSAPALALKELDSIAVIVNEDVITREELDNQVDYFIKQIKSGGGSVPSTVDIRKQILEKMIRDKIQLQLAAQYGISIDDVTLNRMLNQIAESNNISLEQMRAKIESEGVKFSDFREQTRNELIIKQLQQRLVADRVNVTDQEINQFVNKVNKSRDTNKKYRIKHILIAVPESSGPEDIAAAKKEAEQIKEMIDQGADFSELATRKSRGRNALQGGELGWRETSELPEQFVEVIQNMSKGDTSEPIRSASGFHLIKLVDESASENTVQQTYTRHILVRTGSDMNDDQARQLLSDIRARIKQGENFSDLAREFSQDPGSRDSGGELGWSSPGTFVRVFEDVMNNLNVGEISEPFRSQFGWHILQVVDRRRQKSDAVDTRSQAREIIRNRKIEEELDLWLRRIRDEAYVEYMDVALNQNSE